MLLVLSHRWLGGNWRYMGKYTTPHTRAAAPRASGEFADADHGAGRRRPAQAGKNGHPCGTTALREILPNRAIKPLAAVTDSGTPARYSARMPPIKAKGILAMMRNALLSDLKASNSSLEQLL